MSTNIIERLIVEIGLDSSDYNRNSEKTIAQNNRLTQALEASEHSAGKSGMAYKKLSKDQGAAIQSAVEFGKSIAVASRAVVGLFSVILASTGISKLVTDIAIANNGLDTFSKNMGMSTQSIKAWQLAAESSGGSAQGMASSMSNLKQSMNKLVMFGDSSLLPYFNALGLSMVDGYGKARDVNDVMLDLSDALNKMPRDKAYTIASQMGFDDGTINTLMRGRSELEKMFEIQKNMYQSGEKEKKAASELLMQRAKLNAHWESFKVLLADALTPALISMSKVISDLMDYIQNHKDTIKSVFEAAAFVLQVLLIPMLAKALQSVLSLMAPFSPFIIIVSLLGLAFIGLRDDYKTWADGGNSLFDWTKFQNLIDGNIVSVDGLKNSFLELAREVLNSVLPAIQDFMDVIVKIQNGDFKGAFSSLVSLSARPLQGLLNAGHTLAQNVSAFSTRLVGGDPNDPNSTAGKIAAATPFGDQAYRAITGNEVDDRKIGDSSSEAREIAKKWGWTPDENSGNINSINPNGRDAEASEVLKNTKTARAAQMATKKAHKTSQGDCGKYVNNVLKAQGIMSVGHGVDVAQNLINSKQGFIEIPYSKDYVPQVGDVMSIPSHSKSSHQYGHVAIFNGTHWVSDFLQTNQRGNTAAANDQTLQEINNGTLKPRVVRHADNAQALQQLASNKPRQQTVKANLISPTRGKNRFAGFGTEIDGHLEETAKRYGLDVKMLRGIAKKEGGWTGKDSPTGAIGIGQFTVRTWNDLASSREGKEIGMTPVTPSNKGKNNDPRRDNRINTLALGLLVKRNAAMLRDRNLPVTPENVYLFHNVGQGIAAAIKGSDNVPSATRRAIGYNVGKNENVSPTEFVERQSNSFNEHYNIANAGYSPSLNNGVDQANNMLNRASPSNMRIDKVENNNNNNNSKSFSVTFNGGVVVNTAANNVDGIVADTIATAGGAALTSKRMG